MKTTELLAAVFILATLYVLVRPQSKARELVTGFSAALTAIVANATDLAKPTATEGMGTANG